MLRSFLAILVLSGASYADQQVTAAALTPSVKIETLPLKDSELAGEKTVLIPKGAFGLGAMVGTPTGLHAKYFWNDADAVQGQAGATLQGDGFFGAIDVVTQPLVITNNAYYVMPVYVGAGVQFRALTVPDDATRAGTRAVIGTSFDFKQLPIDVFFEGAVAGEFLLSGNDRDFRLPVSIAFGVHYFL